MIPWLHSAFASPTGKALPVAQLSNHMTLAGLTPFWEISADAIVVGDASRNTPKYLVAEVAAEAPPAGRVSAAAISRHAAPTPATLPSRVRCRDLIVLPP